MCVIVQNFLLIGQTIANIQRFFSFFSKWWPSTILELLCLCIDIHKEYLVVFITVQNLVRIDTVVLIRCKCWYLTSLAWKCLFMPDTRLLGDLTPKWGAVTSRTPEGISLCRNTSLDIQTAKIGPSVFAQLTILSNTQNPMLFNGPNTPQNFPFLCGYLDSQLRHRSFCPHKSTTQTACRSVQPFLHSSRQSVPILYNGPTFPLKISPLHRGIWIPSNTWFFGPTRLHNPHTHDSC